MIYGQSQRQTVSVPSGMPHAQHPIEILRFNTCGSVDGKSTFAGRIAALEIFWQDWEHQS